MIDGVSGVAKHDRAGRFEKSQHVDDAVLDIGGRNPDRAIFDVGMAAFIARDVDPECLLLVLFRQCDDAARQGRREQQRAAGRGRGFQDEFHVLAKAEIEHLVGLVEHHRLQLRDIETAAPQMIAQPPRRADHDVGARGQLALLAARIHAAAAGDDARPGVLIEPCQFAMHLQRQFPRRRDDQGQRCRGRCEPLGVAKQFARDGEPIGDGFARAGLGRNQEVAAGSVIRQHRQLDRGRLVVIAFRQCARERRSCSHECHGDDLG